MAEQPGIDIERFSRWLAVARPDLAPASLRAVPIEGGMSNLTFFIEGGVIPLVLRRPPLGHVMATAHDMGREVRVVSALASSAVPVPVVEMLHDDRDGEAGVGAPFYLMRRVDGIVLKKRTDNAPYTATQLHKAGLGLAHALADLHALDPARIGLQDFGRPDGYLTRQVARWTSQLDASRSRSLPELDSLAVRLARSVPESVYAAVLHGDYRLDNCLVDADDLGVRAVLDWEMSTLGDPLADLALFGLYWVLPQLDPVIAGVHASSVDVAAGYPTLEELVDAYAARIGRHVPDLSWYLAFSAFKVAVIAESIHFRHAGGFTGGGKFAEMGRMTGPLTEVGAAYLAGSRDVRH